MRNRAAAARRVVIVVYDDAQILDVACPSGALEIANSYGAAPPYTVELVTYLHRPADQAQINMFLAASPSNRLVSDVLGYIAAHLAEDLSPPTLAARAGVTTRHLNRLFTTHLMTTPARAVRAARTEAAAHLARSSELSMATVARRCGFRSPETLRQAFLDHYGVTGDTIRKMTDMPQPLASGFVQSSEV